MNIDVKLERSDDFILRVLWMNHILLFATSTLQTAVFVNRSGIDIEAAEVCPLDCWSGVIIIPSTGCMLATAHSIRHGNEWQAKC